VSHGIHDNSGVVLFDSCNECWDRVASLDGMADLDENTLQTIVDLHDATSITGVASNNEALAYKNLRLMELILYRAGVVGERILT
jgi:hypothetical protein